MQNDTTLAKTELVTCGNIKTAIVRLPLVSLCTSTGSRERHRISEFYWGTTTHSYPVPLPTLVPRPKPAKVRGMDYVKMRVMPPWKPSKSDARRLRPLEDKLLLNEER